MKHSNYVLNPPPAVFFSLHPELDDLALYLDELQESKQVTLGDLTEALTRYAWLLTICTVVEDHLE